MTDNNHSRQQLVAWSVVNNSGLASNSDHVDWNWTRPEPVHTDPTFSLGFHVFIVVTLGCLIVAGTLLNLVTIVTHIQTVFTLQRTAIDHVRYTAVRCGTLR